MNKRDIITINGKEFYKIDELQTVTKGLFYMVESIIEGENNIKIVRKCGRNFDVIVEKAYNDLDTEIIDFYNSLASYGNAHLI